MKGAKGGVACEWTGVDLVDLVDGVDTAIVYGRSTLSTESTRSTPVH